MKAENPVVYKYEYWSTYGDASPNRRVNIYLKTYRTQPTQVTVRRELAVMIGCVGIRRGVEQNDDGTQLRLYSERHAMVGFGGLYLANTGKTFKELRAVMEDRVDD